MSDRQPSLPRAAREAVRAWYAPRARAYPWRTGRRSAYRTLVAEVMLQQTQAPRVVPIYETFCRRFPTVGALAAADPAAVVRAWAGLGYNRRAIALHRAARAVCSSWGGRVPVEPDALRNLPGVGPYTAAAVASIAGGRPVAAVDVNVRRIVARVSDMGDAPPVAIDRLATSWLDREDPGAWNQALMDLGREHCRAVPRCEGCPLARTCRWRRGVREVVPDPRRRQVPFNGSTRQLRGRIVNVLRSRSSAGPAGLVASTGFPRERVDAAIEGLVRDGIVRRHGRGIRLPAD